MKRLLITFFALLLPLSALAQPDPQNPEGENLSTPPTWKVRLDRPNPEATIGSVQEEVDIWFVNMTPGWHITTGPAAIFYHPESQAEGNYRVDATIYLFDPGERREAYGVFLGGQNLEGDNIEYDYFLLRNTGEYLIKRRTGEETSLIQDWTASDAVANFGPDTEGSVENRLAVEVGESEVVFYVNDEEVVRSPRDEIRTSGVVGLRINHALNVHVSELAVTSM